MMGIQHARPWVQAMRARHWGSTAARAHLQAAQRAELEHDPGLAAPRRRAAAGEAAAGARRAGPLRLTAAATRPHMR